MSSLLPTTRTYPPVVAFVLLVVASNVLTATFGLVDVGPIAVTAGTFTAGLVLVARDGVHELGGIRAVVYSILAGAAISAWGVTPRLAAASAIAFLVSELADLLVYSRVRRRFKFGAASIASNVVGAAVDSTLFLALAGFPILAALPGQILVKIALSTAAVGAVKLAVLRHPLIPSRA